MPTPNHRNAPIDSAALFADLLMSDDDLRTLARKHCPCPVGRGDPLRRLSRWSKRPSVRRVVEALIELLETRNDFSLARNRGVAVQALKDLAISTEHPESARKACVDLLKLRPDDRAGASTDAATDGVSSSTRVTPKQGPRARRATGKREPSNATSSASAHHPPIDANSIRAMWDRLDQINAYPAKEHDDEHDPHDTHEPSEG